MRVVMFYHSLISDWNHGNAHFLRGVASELLSRGHDVRVFEPADGWSIVNLTARYGNDPVRKFHQAFPQFTDRIVRYDLATMDLDRELAGADLVIVHEWNDHGLVRRIGSHRAMCGGYRLLFHDTHHRAVTDRESIASYDLRHYDGVLAYGCVIRDIYLGEGWTQRAWTWHEAADTRIFRPAKVDRDGGGDSMGDVVWIGNWGDEERTGELFEFFVEPVRSLGLKALACGVRYPEAGLEALARSGIQYGGWVPNYEAPAIFARFRATVHIPRRPYVRALPGIPTIRPFEALACGIPLVCSPWEDAEGLFTPGRDYLTARDGKEMKRHLEAVIRDDDTARELASHGLQTILSRHTCGHRVDELLAIYDSLRTVG